MKRRVVLTLIVVGVVSAAALTWKLWPRTPPRPPELDPSGVDPVVWRAIEAARAEVERAPQSSRSWGRLGMMLLAHQFRSESLPCLARAEHLDPHDAHWAYYQALAVRRTDPEAAIAHLRRAVAVGAEYDGARLLLAELLVQRGELDQAERLFQEVLRRAPGNSRANLGLAQAAFERDDVSACLEHLRRAQDDSHTRKAAHTFLAEVQQRRGDRIAAETAWREAQALPDDAAWPDPLAEPMQEMVVGHLAVITRAAALLQQNQPEQAIPLLQRAAQDYPDSSWACVLLGKAWLRIGNPSAAEKALQESVRRDPQSVEAHFYLGVIMSEQKHFASALPYFRKAAQLKPDYALAWYNLGFCHKQKGERAAARAAFEKAVACKPQLAEARVNLGELLAEDGDIAAAQQQLRQALHLLPNDRRALRLLETLQHQAKP